MTEKYQFNILNCYGDISSWSKLQNICGILQEYYKGLLLKSSISKLVHFFSFSLIFFMLLSLYS